MSEQIYDTFTYICGECGDLVYVTKGRDTHTHESSTGEVNGGPVAHFPTDGADDAPNEPKGAVPNPAPASLVDSPLSGDIALIDALTEFLHDECDMGGASTYRSRQVLEFIEQWVSRPASPREEAP